MLRKYFAILLILSVFCGFCNASICAKLKRVSGGEDHTLALMENNTLWACGNNGLKQLGLGSDVLHSYTLKKVLGENGNGFLTNIATFDAGWKHSLAANSDGTLWAWGSDPEGQLGNGSGENDWDVPQKVHGINDAGYLSDIVYVSAGRSGQHSLAVDSNGYLYAWGWNEDGQCGNGRSGDDEQEDVPVLVLDDDPNTTDVYLGDIAFIIQADAGIKHSIALDDEGHVWHWGYRSDSGIYPEKVKALSSFGGEELSYVIQISSCDHSIAVDSNGYVWEWSYSDSAYMVTDGEMYTASGYLEDIVEVGAGNGYSMARTSDGHVLYWSTGGSPIYAEDGEMYTQSGLLENITSIGAGYSKYHMLTVCQNGYGWVWGDNDYGKLGVGDTTDREEPTQMWCAGVSESIYLTKTAEILGSEPNCASPFIGFAGEDNYLVYDVNFGNSITNPSDPNYYGTLYDVNIIDHLPFEVDFNSVTGGGIYDPNTHTVTWTIDELAPGDSNSFTITTEVNHYARPGGTISNFVEMVTDAYYTYASNSVPVCNWGTEIIYVDDDANGYNNGTNWEDAYNTIQDAFVGANSLGAEITAIWVAAGTYKPVESTEIEDYKYYSFDLLENVALFGHFAGYETNINQRDFSDTNNTTILEGQIGESASYAVYDVVKAINLENTILDGFTIQGSYDGSGIYLSGADIPIVNCKLKNNNNCGIEVRSGSHPDIHNCIFIDNTTRAIITLSSEPNVSYSTFDGGSTTDYGIYMRHGSVYVTDSIFKNHYYYGIYGNGGTLTVGKSTFENNSEGLEADDLTVTLTDSLIKDSANWGIWASDSDLTIERCLIHNSQSMHGIYMRDYSTIDIANSVIRQSGQYGLDFYKNSQISIENCWIHDNGYSGIYIESPSNVPLLSNNTIVKNSDYGIKCYLSTIEPNISNCIIYDNDDGDLYSNTGVLHDVNYCNLQNSHSGTGNITGDPCFINIAIDLNDLHIAEASQCKNAGNPNGSYGDLDIDGENRVCDSRIDIGADEYYWSAADYDLDGMVNFTDYCYLANDWQSSPSSYSLDGDNDVDFDDLALFCVDWLWEVAWEQGWMMCMGSDGGAFESMFLAQSELLSIESSAVIIPEIDSSLMLSAAESSAKRPASLIEKTQKFYDITPDTTISAKQTTFEASRVGIEDMLKWLDEIWLDGDLDSTLTEAEYLEFRKDIESLK